MNSNLEHKGYKKLKEAFKEVNQWEYENLHLDDLEEVIPSVRYQKRMARLIRQQKHPFWKYFNTLGKRIAVISLVIALTLACSMSVSAVREPIVEFITNMYEKFVEIVFDQDDIAKSPETIETVYTLGYIPEGYSLHEEVILDNRTSFVWVNNDFEQIIFTQYILAGNYSLDNENGDFEILHIADKKIAYMNKYGTKKIYWNTEDYAFSLMLPASFSEEECLRIVKLITISR